MPRIPDYPAQTSANNADLLVIEDMTAGSTKHISRENFLKGSPLPNDSVTTAALAPTSVTSPKLNLSKTVDANGWTVYDFGGWKEYAITKQWTAGNPASLAVVQTTIPYPSGLTSGSFMGSSSTHVANVTTVGPTASEIFQATTNVAATSGANMTIYVKNMHSATQAFGSVTTSVRVVAK